MKNSYKKHLLIAVCFIIYFLIRFKTSHYITSLMITGGLIDIACYPFSYYIYHIFFNSLFGGLMGITYILNQRKKSGKWEINKTKMVVFVIPLLILSFGEFIYYYNSNIFLIRTIIEYFNISLTLIQILCGYVIIKTFYKNSEK